MKKYFIILFIIIFSLASYIIIKSYNINILHNLLDASDGICHLYIKSVDKSDSEQVNKHIFQCIKNQSLDIYYLSFDNLLPHKKQQISIYVNNFNKIKNNIKLKSGRYLKSSDNINLYLSSEINSDINQVGVIQAPNKKTKIYIRSIRYKINHEYDNLLSSFFVNTTNQTKLFSLIKDLESKYNIKIQNIGELDYTSNFDVFESLKILIILYILIIILLIYMIFERYKELAIYKLFGLDNFNLNIKIIFKEILVFNIKAVVITYFLSLIYLYIFNNFYGLLSFSVLWLKIIFIILIANLSVSIIIINFLTKFIKISLMLKNKKHTNISIFINYIFKIISLSILINLVISSYINISLLLVDNNFLKSWEESKYLAKINIKSNFIKKNNSNIDFGDKFAHKFFVLTNQKNGILIDTTNYISEDEFIKNKEPYSIERSININNNYLKLNHIYDINNNIINIPDHDDITVNLLVPIKYKIYEDKIKKIYINQYNNKPDINIIYIKNNQKYFTFKLDSSSSRSYITDPIVNIISNNNAFLDIYYGCAITNSYYIKINNIKFPAKDLIKDLKQSGFDKYISSINTVYEMISNKLYNKKNQVINMLSRLLIDFIVLITLIIFITLNYLEKNKLENFVLKIHGVNYIRRHFQYYLVLINIWIISLCFVLLIFFVFDYKNIIIICFLIDIIISSFLLRIYEQKKINNIIKGE